MLCGATGIKRKFYQPFAEYLASQGFGVISFDFRGTGDSLLGKVRQSPASLVCWGTLDMPAVLDTLKRCFNDTRYHLVGHSAGGQLIGLMPNAQSLDSIVTFGASAGRLANFHPWYRLKAHIFMNLFIPVSNLVLGYTAADKLGMGQPLPPKVAAQWRAWCSGKGYPVAGFGKEIKQHYYPELRQPALWMFATDDDIAGEANVEELLMLYSQLKVKRLRLTPKESASGKLGHMGFFRPDNKPLWHYVSDWLNHYHPL